MQKFLRARVLRARSKARTRAARASANSTQTKENSKEIDRATFCAPRKLKFLARAARTRALTPLWLFIPFSSPCVADTRRNILCDPRGTPVTNIVLTPHPRVSHLDHSRFVLDKFSLLYMALNLECTFIAGKS